MSVTISVEGIEENIRPWLNAQRIGMAAHGVMEVPRLIQLAQEPQRRDKLAEIYGDLQLALVNALQAHFEGPEAPRRRLEQLPPSVLFLLYTALTKAPQDIPPDIKTLLQSADNVKETLTGLNARASGKKSAKHPSPLGKAQIMAYHILDSVASARRLLALGEALGEPGWDSIAADHDQLDELLQWIRTPQTDTLTTLFAISRLGELLQPLALWPQIENLLLTQTFCWPLLILSEAGVQEVAIGLPVAIALDFENTSPKGRAIVRSRQSAQLQHGGVNPSQWQGELDCAVEAAKALWRGKHGNHGLYAHWRETPEDFRWKVDRANVIFEFHWANCILGSIPISPHDGSATTYFAMAVLARLLGRRNYVSSVVTGGIGEPCREDEESQREEQDFWVTPPSDSNLAAKLRYLFAAQTFERVALPQGCEKTVYTLLRPQDTPETPAEAKGGPTSDDDAPAGVPDTPEMHAQANDRSRLQTAEVAFGAKLSHLADIVQTGGWRQYRYIRCPDLQWALHEKYYAQRPGLMGTADIHVRRVLHLLRSNTSPILDLQNEPQVTPRAVASALWHINLGEDYRLRQRPRVPMFSSLFIRATHDQQDSRFWESLWRACGAPMTDFEQFHRAPSPARAAEMLAEVLNRFQPLEKIALSHRAPDILVMIDAEHFARSLARAGNPEARALAVESVLHELGAQEHLKVAPNAQSLVQFLGQTRIVLLRDDSDHALDADALKAAQQLSPHEHVALSALSAFRWGFNHMMASLVLHNPEIPALTDYRGVWGRQIRAFLFGLCEQGVLRYGQGWYHLPRALGDQLQQALSKLERAQYHVAAGTALAPYTMDASVPSLAFDQAFLPEHVYEAFFHLDRAGRLANTAGTQGGDLGRTALNRKVRLLRFATFPTWSTLRDLTNCAQPPAYREAYTMGKELLKAREASTLLHPSQYSAVIQSGRHWLRSEDRPHLQRALQEELTGTGGLCDKALEACALLPSQSQRDFNHLALLSLYANCLADLARKGLESLESSERVETLDREVLQRIAASPDARGVQGEWFERRGNDETSPAAAAHYYKLGVQWVPEWHQLWVLALGATALAGEDLAWVAAPLQEYAERRVSKEQGPFSLEETVIHILSYANKRSLDRFPPRVKERWNTGAQVVGKLWGHFPEVRRALRELKKYQ